MTTAERQTTHTPGPWRIEDVCIVGPDSERREYTKDDGTTDTHPTQLVALAYGSGAGRNGERYTMEANARLIAAAPELLAALTSLADFFPATASGTGPDWRALRLHVDDMNRARAAIAKATGQP